MNPETYAAVTERATEAMAAGEKRAGFNDRLRKLEAQLIIDEQIRRAKEEGKVYELAEEEIRLLESFRRFKLRVRKDGEVFTWQTRKPEGVQQEVAVNLAGSILPPMRYGRFNGSPTLR